jgi:hypothetical protein
MKKKSKSFYAYTKEIFERRSKLTIYTHICKDKRTKSGICFENAINYKAKRLPVYTQVGTHNTQQLRVEENVGLPLAGIFWHGLLDEKRVNCKTFAGGLKNAIILCLEEKLDVFQITNN